MNLEKSYFWRTPRAQGTEKRRHKPPERDGFPARKEFEMNDGAWHRGFLRLLWEEIESSDGLRKTRREDEMGCTRQTGQRLKQRKSAQREMGC
jgi:hypothetical protein